MIIQFLIFFRSPPPVHWPAKMDTDLTDWRQSDFRALSPESGVGSDNDNSVPVRSDTMSRSVERIISPLSGDLLSPVRGQTPAVSPARGQTPDNSLSSSHPPAPISHENRSYTRSISQSSTRLRSKTPDEEFSPSRQVQIYSRG